VTKTISGCVETDPVKRMVQSIHYVRLFALNCPNIQLIQQDGKKQLLDF